MVRAGSRFSVTTWAVCTNTKEPGDGSAQTGHRTCPTRRDGGSKATEAPLNRGFFATRSLTKKRAATPASSGSKASCQSGSGSPYRSGRSRHWVKSKNPAAPSVKREAEEDGAEGVLGSLIRKDESRCVTFTHLTRNALSSRSSWKPYSVTQRPWP